MRLQGKVAIVTGGGHGIGAAYCAGFAGEGASVVAADIDGAAAERVAAELQGRGHGALGLLADVADEASVRNMAAAAVERFGRIDVLVNNAAIFHSVPMSRGHTEEISVDEWDRMMAVNLRGLFLCCRAVLPVMRRQGKGKIINISSGTALKGSPTRIHYVTSKAGVIGFTRSLAREMGAEGIRVNAIAPGNTQSEDQPTEEQLSFHRQASMQRALPHVQQPQDLVGAAVFLASDESDFITGQTIAVDGGSAMI